MCIEFQHLTGQVLVIKCLAYLLILVFLENSKNDSKLNDWINFGNNWKKLLSHSRPRPWVCGLGLACLWPRPWLTVLDLALTPLALLTSLMTDKWWSIHCSRPKWQM